MPVLPDSTEFIMFFHDKQHLFSGSRYFNAPGGREKVSIQTCSPLSKEYACIEACSPQLCNEPYCNSAVFSISASYNMIDATAECILRPNTLG